MAWGVSNDIQKSPQYRQLQSKINKLKQEGKDKDAQIVALTQLKEKADRLDKVLVEIEELKKENANLKRSNAMLRKT